MPGIVGFCSIDFPPGATAAKLEKMVTSILHEPWYQVVRASAASMRCACVHLGHFRHALSAATADGKVGVVLDGWLFSEQSGARTGEAGVSPAEGATYCLERYRERGIEFVHSLNGQFNLLIWDDVQKNVFLVNDRYGTRPWQYFQRDGALYFAPEAKAIFAAAALSRQLNARMVVNQLSWGRIWIGQETLFENVVMLGPGSILCWHHGKTRVEQYWDYVYRPEPVVNEDFVDHVVDAFRKGVARQTETRLRYGIGLTGGLDSRSVLAAMTSKSKMDLSAHTWGMSESHDEVTLARRVAQCQEIPWRFHDLRPADFITRAEQGVFLTEGLDLFVQSYGLKVFPDLRDQIDVLITGHSLDLTLGGTYLPRAVASGRLSSDQAFIAALESAAYFSPEECARLIRLDETDQLLEELRAVAKRDWQAGQNSEPADQCDRFFLHSRVARYTFARQTWHRYFVEDLLPSYDNEFVDCQLRVPADWRAGHRFYQRFLARLDPRMMEITYQRTMLPPAAPMEFWTQAAQLEQQREQLYRDVWRATKGAVFVPYQRYMTNYDEWLRCDASWIEWTDNLLLSPNSLSCERFLDRQAVQSLIADHRSAKASNHKKILQLLTFELFLREFFD